MPRFVPREFINCYNSDNNKEENIHYLVWVRLVIYNMSRDCSFELF